MVECLPRMLKTQGLISSSAQKLGMGPVEVTQWESATHKHYAHNHHIIEEEAGITVQRYNTRTSEGEAGDGVQGHPLQLHNEFESSPGLSQKGKGEQVIHNHLIPN